MGLPTTPQDGSPISFVTKYILDNPTQTLFAFLGTLYLVYCLQSYLRLRHVPGPFLARHTYFWFANYMAKGKILDLLPKLHAKYGPVCRIGPNSVLLGDIDELIRINSFRDGLARSDWYRNMRFDWTGDVVVSMVDTAQHDARKAILQRAYEGRGEADLEKQMESQIERLVELIKEHYLGKVVDWAEVARWYSIDLATLATVGKPWGSMDSRSDVHGFFQVSDEVIPFNMTITTLDGLRQITANGWFLRLFGPKVTDKAGVGKYMQFTKEEIARRFANPDPKPKDMLGEWMKQGLPKADLEREIVLAALVGADTSAIPLRAAIFYVGSTPYVYNKLKAEIAEGIKSGRISSPVTFREAKALPYLQAVLLEVFRVFPPSSTGFAKRVGPGGGTFCGVKLPAGTDIYPNKIALVRNKAVFGEDVDVFRPERWLEAKTPADRAFMERHVDFLFGGGRFKCPGKTYTWLELSKILVEIFRNFDVQVARPERPFSTKMYSTITVSDMPVIFTEGKI